MESPAERDETGSEWRSEKRSQRPSKRLSDNGRVRACAGREEGPRDSWVDAIVTLLATIVFGLGWALVELERADLGQDRYDAALSVTWSLGDPSQAWSEPWTEMMQEGSRR